MTGPWSEEELIIAMEFYRVCPRNTHTDSHKTCKQMAKMLARSPGALEKTIQNIHYAATGGTGLGHGSKLIWSLIDQYKNDLSGVRKRAAAIRKKYGWPPLDCGN
jgi:hypothetical protein